MIRKINFIKSVREENTIELCKTVNRFIGHQCKDDSCICTDVNVIHVQHGAYMGGYFVATMFFQWISLIPDPPKKVVIKRRENFYHRGLNFVNANWKKIISKFRPKKKKPVKKKKSAAK